jgi:rRNA maturation endonuclease Nob1
MVKLTINSLIFIYTLCSVIVLLIIWIISSYKGRKWIGTKEADYIWRCSVCFNNYVDSKHEDISVCPLCGSYNKKEEERGA